MSGWLLGTNVLSALAPGRLPLRADTVRWFERRADDLFLSAILATEIEAGIAKLRRAGTTRKVAQWEEWFGRILDLYADRVLPFDLEAARIAGKLGDAAIAAGQYPGFADVAVAAIAMSRELAVLTANLRHFAPLGVPALNPFEAA